MVQRRWFAWRQAQYSTAGRGRQGIELTLGGDPEVEIGDDGAFDLSTPEEGVAFRGQFAADGKSVRGVWEVAPDGAPPDGARVLAEEWALER